MSESIIVALITAGLTLIGTVITVLASSKQTLAALDKKQELSDEKLQGQLNVVKTEIETLSKRVEAHNNVIERTYVLEGRMTEAEHEIRDLKGAKAS